MVYNDKSYLAQEIRIYQSGKRLMGEGEPRCAKKREIIISMGTLKASWQKRRNKTEEN